ncbi:hypothetical protein B9G69_003860 [Bdellovibrio sp. SKB1291214]|uniref:hypothetical protein n=1 Tax=Bdellovibrio sp. SKB1291214 TaxID=1732569 RepID=UPI000B51AF35|nr:hypothetical protein [Bdellovibrio sp. SKB1291214]UYL09709.1 hypothetical protein B9G69_003860 [Bdellovibrio sp. SKB1291214]
MKKSILGTIATLLVTSSAFATSPLKIECRNSDSKSQFLFNITAEVSAANQLTQVTVVSGYHGQVWTSHHESITEQDGKFIFNQTDSLKVEAGLLEQALRSNTQVQFPAILINSNSYTPLTCVSK